MIGLMASYFQMACYVFLRLTCVVCPFSKLQTWVWNWEEQPRMERFLGIILKEVNI